MRLTSFTDFGLRVLMRMASAPDQIFSTADLAEEFSLSRHHLNKIMQRLARGGIVATRRGAGGGAVMARAPGDVRLGEIVRLLEEDQALVSCFAPAGICSIMPVCRLKVHLGSAEAAFLADLDRHTLADISLPAPSDSHHRLRSAETAPAAHPLTQQEGD